VTRRIGDGYKRHPVDVDCNDRPQDRRTVLLFEIPRAAKAGYEIEETT